jgi:hypothetical protein
MGFLDQFAHDIGPWLAHVEGEGKVALPYEVEVIGGDEELLGVFQVNVDGKFELTTLDRHIANAVPPFTVAVEDAEGNRCWVVWSPALPS